MPIDLLELYCRRICGLLRRKINAEIYVNYDVNSNEIDVEISWYDFQYRCVINNVHTIVYRGISSENIGNWILKNYREAVLSEAFL